MSRLLSASPVAVTAVLLAVVSTACPPSTPASTPSSGSNGNTAKNAMQNCPTAVQGAAVALKDVDGGIEIAITGSGDATAQIRQRAKLIAAASTREATGAKHDGKGDGGGLVGRCPVVMYKSSVVAADTEGGAILTVKADVAADVDWLRKETRTRLNERVAASAGPGKMARCPSAVDGALTTVTDAADGVVVTVAHPAKDAATVADIRKRATELLASAASQPNEVGHAGHGQGGGGFGRCPILVTDTVLASKEIDGGIEVSVKPKDAARLADVQREARARADRFAARPASESGMPSSPAPGTGTGAAGGTGGGTGGGGSPPAGTPTP